MNSLSTVYVRATGTRAFFYHTKTKKSWIDFVLEICGIDFQNKLSTERGCGGVVLSGL
jgi:hypothetical protein